MSTHDASLHGAGSRRVAPGPPGHPLVGCVPEMRGDTLRFLLELGEQYGDIVRLPLGPFLGHLLRGPEYVRHVLQDNNKNYGRKTRGFEALRETLGNGLLTSEGSFWQRQRRIAQPAFHRQRLAGFASIMASAADEMTRRLRTRDNQQLDVVPELLAVTLKILGLSMFGIDLSDDAAAIGHAVGVIIEATREAATAFVEIPRFIPTPANRRFNEARATVDRLVYGMIAERRRGGGGQGDLLDMLMEARDEETGEAMNDAQLRDELVTIVGAGHETTAMSLSWTFVLLSRFPAARRRLEAELDEVLGDRTPSLADLPKLVYTKAVLEESMRIYPPAWMVARHAIADDTIGGYHIPAGSFVFFSPWVTHRHAGLWEDPEGFDPDRFAPGAEEGRPRYAYYPFGGGPHLCIGNSFAMMEATIVLATVASRLRLDLVPGHPIVPQPLVTLRPKHGVVVRVRPRAGR